MNKSCNLRLRWIRRFSKGHLTKGSMLIMHMCPLMRTIYSFKLLTKWIWDGKLILASIKKVIQAMESIAMREN